MQRVLITITVVALVVIALAVGALAAHWPFWQRAWQWQTAADGWAEALPGPAVRLSAAGNFLPLKIESSAELATLAGAGTQMLLVGESSGRVAAWFAAGTNERTLIDGRGLSSGLLGPLFGTLHTQAHASLLDVPLLTFVPGWDQDARGAITPRQLLWQLSGLKGGAFTPLNPWSHRAQLASGPDFMRAALHTKLKYPPGTHFELAPANAQLLALVASLSAGGSYATVLEQQLWSRFAEYDAIGLLDHRRGQMAAHCCIQAAAADWLRLGLLLASGGRSGQSQVVPAGHVAEMNSNSAVHPDYGLGFQLRQSQDGRQLWLLETAGRRLAIAPHSGRAVLWVGTGAPPSELDDLLAPAGFAFADTTVVD